MTATTLPRTLPADAKGFTQRLVVHMNFGRDGASAAYDIHAPDGTKLPITFAYRTGKHARRGFYLTGSAEPMTWAQLVAAWPRYVLALERLHAKGLAQGIGNKRRRLAWLKRWRDRLTRKVRHPGNHRYAFRIEPATPITYGPDLAYPKRRAA